MAGKEHFEFACESERNEMRKVNRSCMEWLRVKLLMYREMCMMQA